MGRVHGIQLRTPLPTTLLNLRTVMKVTLFILLVGAVVETMGQDDYSWPGQFVPTSRHCSFDRYRWISDGELLQSLPSSSAHECMFLCKYREQRASDTDIRQHHGICTRFYYMAHNDYLQCELYSGGVYSSFQAENTDYAGTCV